MKSTTHLTIEEAARGGYCVINHNTQWAVFHGTKEQCEQAIKLYAQGRRPRWDDMP